MRCLVFALACIACRVTTTPPTARVRVYAPQIQTTRIIAPPTSCGNRSKHCKDHDRSLIDSIVRSEFDFAGFTIVDGERVAIEVRERTQELVEDWRGDNVETKVEGTLYSDLNLGEQRAVLQALEIGLILQSRMFVETDDFDYFVWAIAVEVWIEDETGKVLVKSRCRVSDERRVERSAACAAKGALVGVGRL